MGSKGHFIMAALFMALGFARLTSIGQPLISGSMVAVGVLWLVQGWRTRRKEMRPDDAQHLGTGAATQKIVQCERGSYFTTTWVPGASLTSLRVGSGERVQYCPVHEQSEKIRRVPEDELSQDIRAAAAEHRQ